MKLISRPLLVVAVVVGLTAIGCTNSDGGDTTTTTSATADLTTEEQAFIDAYVDDAEGDVDVVAVLAAADQLCVTLEILQAAGSPPGHAASAIEMVLLEDASAIEKANFGLILALAPSTVCDEVLRYAENVSYWLGY